MTQIDDIRAAMNASPTGQHLLLGEFVLPFATGEADPTGQTTNVTDGRAQLWIDGDGNLQLSIYSRTQQGWTTVGQSVLETVTDLVDTRFATQENGTDLKDVLVTAELIEDNGATPLDLDGGAATVGDLTISGTITGTGSSLAFRGKTPVTIPLIAGSRSGDTTGVLSLILQAGEDQGFWNDTTTA